ncbi:MAG: GDSL family lipase [Planctomycetes bacterium]|nr:GDSL family lipase [Planctomycetota bacterium]
MKPLQKSVLAIALMGVIGLSVAGCNGSQLTCSQVADQRAGSTNPAVQPVPRPEKWWNKRHAMINEWVKPGDTELLFVGDSITHAWEGQGALWNERFGQWKPVNAGISGDRTEHVLWRLENGNVDGISPKLAVVMIGTNNSPGDYNTAEQIAQGVETVVCTLRTKLPQTKVLVLAIFPRGSAEQRKSKTVNGTYNSQWAKNDRANKLIEQLADGKMIHFLSINKAFLDDEGILTREIMFDLLHLTPKGYQVWAEAMGPTLEELMSEN